ncbi:hypothetical protein ACFV8E_40320 [Streptomyces sp. NPDC059849]|uniref:hypothetical protein n=1 Tax=Streptomyces sp. NPDC059849 TaxID=3346969 RepID=UPI0036638040
MEDQDEAPVRDVRAIMEASGYVRHGGVMARGGSYDSCICPKALCGGVATGTEHADCPEHALNPAQVWHWAAECPGNGGAPASPLGQAGEAKRRRDLGAEVDALVGGHRALTEAAWYPSRPGDRLMVTREATGQSPRTTELYEVTEDGGDGMELCLVDVTPEGASGGWYAGPPEMYGADPVETPWMEAGPDRLTVTREGVIVHQGRHALPRPGITEQQLTPGAVALGLIRTTALDEAARHAPGAGGPPPANWEMHRALTSALESWQKGGRLREESVLLAECLAVELSAYVATQVGDQDRVDRWLRDFGDQVCQVQQHAHPAGPTAVEILSVVAGDRDAPQGPAGAERLARVAAPYLMYLRDGHRVEDAREIALTLALWAGSQLAALMLHDPDRITSYLNAREG